MNYAFLHCPYEIDDVQGHSNDSEFSLFSAVITAESLSRFSCWWCEQQKMRKQNHSYRVREKFFESRQFFVTDFSRNTKWWIWRIFKNKQSKKKFLVSSSSSAWELLIIHQKMLRWVKRKEVSIWLEKQATSFSGDNEKEAGQRWFQTSNIIQ